MIVGSPAEASVVACERRLDIARRWLTACSRDSCRFMVDALETFSDEKLADMCISSWGLEESQGDDNDISWFEAHSADRDLVIWAFAMQRSSPQAQLEK